jgi:nucleoside diphosphate kinase
MSEPNPLAPQAETTFCLIKPALVHMNLYPEIIQYLQRNKFMILSSRNIFLTKDIIHEMLKPFFTVMPERVMTSMLGGCVSVELAREGAIEALRHCTGHDDPSQAKMGTIRYMWGQDQANNAVFVPKNEAEFRHMFGCIDLWSRVFLQALNAQIMDPVAWSEARFNEIFNPIEKVRLEIGAEEKFNGNEFDLPSEKTAVDKVTEGYPQEDLPLPMGGA